MGASDASVQPVVQSGVAARVVAPKGPHPPAGKRDGRGHQGDAEGASAAASWWRCIPVAEANKHGLAATPATSPMGTPSGAATVAPGPASPGGVSDAAPRDVAVLLYPRGPMQYAESILDLVGETPLVRLTRVTRDLGPVGAPAARARQDGIAQPWRFGQGSHRPAHDRGRRAGRPAQAGGTIIEPTSGNTGHGLAIAAALKGYRCIFVMADKQSSEKQQLLRAYGAEVVLCPTNVAPESPESYYSVARRLARDIPGAFQPDQYHNMENPKAHELTTGPEIWRQTDGRITHAVFSAGTGGTISGSGRYLKAQNPGVVVVGADPEGSVLSGDVARPYLTEGVGEDFFPGTYDASVVDRWVRVSDRDAFHAARRLTREEGILAGGSCGTALVAALTVARELTESGAGKDAVMVVLLPDSGRSYLSKVYNDEWMRANGLMGWETGRDRVGAVLDGAPSRAGAAVGGPGADDGHGGDGHRHPPALRHQPAAGDRARRRRHRGHRRLHRRARPAGAGLPRPVGGGADRGRGHAAAAAA